VKVKIEADPALTLKIAIVLVCFALCGTGTSLPQPREKNQAVQMNTIPVKNHEIARRIWIQV
jgi:hypothetical protein